MTSLSSDNNSIGTAATNATTTANAPSSTITTPPEDKSLQCCPVMKTNASVVSIVGNWGMSSQDLANEGNVTRSHPTSRIHNGHVYEALDSRATADGENAIGEQHQQQQEGNGVQNQSTGGAPIPSHNFSRLVAPPSSTSTSVSSDHPPASHPLPSPNTYFSKTVPIQSCNLNNTPHGLKLAFLSQDLYEMELSWGYLSAAVAGDNLHTSSSHHSLPATTEAQLSDPELISGIPMASLMDNVETIIHYSRKFHCIYLLHKSESELLVWIYLVEKREWRRCCVVSLIQAQSDRDIKFFRCASCGNEEEDEDEEETDAQSGHKYERIWIAAGFRVFYIDLPFFEDENPSPTKQREQSSRHTKWHAAVDIPPHSTNDSFLSFPSMYDGFEKATQVTLNELSVDMRNSLITMRPSMMGMTLERYRGNLFLFGGNEFIMNVCSVHELREYTTKDTAANDGEEAAEWNWTLCKTTGTAPESGYCTSTTRIGKYVYLYGMYSHPQTKQDRFLYRFDLNMRHWERFKLTTNIGVHYDCSLIATRHHLLICGGKKHNVDVQTISNCFLVDLPEEKESFREVLFRNRAYEDVLIQTMER